MKEMVGGCCVCSEELGWTENPLVYCDGQGCNVAVHQACYGIIQVPSGPWFCRKCESQERAARVKCELCPQREGALKRTDSGGWCHVVCALYIPEAWFGNVQTMEPIILKGLPPERFNKGGKRRTGNQDNGAIGKSVGICYICEENGHAARGNTGCCMKCNKKSCKQYFHVTCAQGQGLLCEEQGNYQDNVKYCGYCSYHYKKLVTKKDSHIKIIPAFKPVASLEPATPDNTPEKPLQPQVRMDRSKVKEGKMKNPTVSLETITAFNTSSGAPPNLSTSSSSSATTTSTSTLSSTTSPANSSSTTTSSSTSAPSTPSGGTLGKFTTANFTETTITPSPANLGELLTGSGEKSSSPAAHDKPVEKSNSNNTRRKPVLGSRTPPQSRTPPRTPPQSRSKTPPATTSAPSRSADTASLSSSTSSYGSSVGQPKDNKKHISSDFPLSISAEKTRERTSSMCSNSSVGSSSSTVSASSETHIQNGAMMPNGDDVKPIKSIASTTTPSTTVSPSSFNYSFESYVKSNYPGAQVSPSKQDDTPILSVAHSATEPAGKRPRSRSTDKLDKRKGKRQKMGTAIPATGAGSGGNTSRAMKDLTESGASESTGSVGSLDIDMKTETTRKPGPAKRKKQDSFSLSGLPPINYRSTYSSEHLGTTPISIASLQKQVSPKGDGDVVKDPFEPDFDTPETPVNSSPSKSLLGRRSSPVIRRGASAATDSVKTTSTATTTTAGSLNTNSAVTASASGSGSTTSSVTTAASPSSSTPGTSATPPAFFPSSSSGDGSAEPFLNGPISNMISAPPKPHAMMKASGSGGLGSPIKGNTECAGGTGASCSMPTSMEQLLERQWEQGSAFLIEQGQHFDIASLLNCLHQLRQENQRLEEHITALTARRDHLLAVNARLSIPLSTPNTPHNSTTGSSQGTSPDSGSHQRSPRINNYLPPESAAELGRNTGRSPAHSQSPAQNHISAASSANQSPAGSLNTSLSSQTQSPDGRGAVSSGTTVVTSSPSNSASQAGSGSLLTEAQKHQMLLHHHQQQIAAMGHLTVSAHNDQEQQQTLMYQVMQQQQAERAAAVHLTREAPHRDNSAGSSSGTTVPTSRAQQQQKHSAIPTSNTGSSSKPNTQDKMKGKS